MSLMHRFCLGFVFAILASASGAQQSVPEHRFVYSRGVDFYGDDLGKLFDTTQEACARACAAQNTCVAFTFNTRSNACFPKSALTERQAYDGATSALKLSTAPAVLKMANDRTNDIAFVGKDTLRQAAQMVATNAVRFPVNDQPIEAVLASLAAAQARGNVELALRRAGQAIARTDRSDLWARYAQISLSDMSQLKRSTQRRINRAALPAAINAYLRAPNIAQRVNSLEILAKALEKNRRGRQMIPALRLAYSLTPRPDINTALDAAIGKYGFRVTEHRVDNNAAAPRICAEFSEKLVQAGVDYESYVRVEGRGLAVQADGSQLCIDGVNHGARYTVTLRQGLPSNRGEVLHKDVRLQLYVRDRAPTVRFPGRAYVLPRSADAALPIETVNVDQVDLRLRKLSDRNLVRAIRESYFGRPLSRYQDEQFTNDLAQEIWTGTGQTRNDLNIDMTTRLPMGEALEQAGPGIYALSAAVPGQDMNDTPAATQWFVLSDLGLSTWSGTDGLHVAVRGLGDADAREGITLTLISRANAILGIVQTNAEGFARFDPGLTRGTGAAQPALLMAQEADIDIAFLLLSDPAFDLSDRGVEGRPPSPPIDTFLTTDRGAYRVGDTIFATVLTRNGQAQAINDLPVTAILKRPDGVEYSRSLSQNVVAGGHVFSLPLGNEVPRGAWRLDIKSDVDGPALASQTLLVEDFLPERIDFTLNLPEAPLRLRDTPPLNVDVRYLFGAPGADLQIEGDVRLRASRTLAGWQGYKFGRYDMRFNTRTRALPNATTNAEGKATLAFKVPQVEEIPTQPLRAEVILRVSEGSGRPVERRLSKVIMPSAAMIGIKAGFEDVLSEGANAPFEMIAIGPDGQTQQMQVRWTLNKVETRYQWYQLYGNWEWEPTTRRIRVDSAEVTLGATPTALSLPTEWGAYELVVETVGNGAYIASSVSFSSGWYGDGEGTDTPDRLALSLDATTYDLGDTAALRIVPKADGIALITVLSNRMIERKVVAVSEGENLIPLDVTAEWGTGAYVTASVLHPMDVAAGQNSARSLGLVHAAVRPAGKQLNVSFDTPETVDGQAGILRVAVQVDGIAAGETAHVTLAAVDVGILNLTGFTPPDVTGHYFGQRRLGVEMRDIYGRLIDGMNGAMGSVRSGGDAASSAQRQSPPPTEALMATFSGPVTVGPDGRAEIEIIRPAFNGTIKLMAVAWSPSAVGNAAQDVIARDPVVVTASLPRFLAPEDESRLLLELIHADGPSGQMKLAIYADAGVAVGDVPQTVLLEDKGSVRLNIPLRGREAGDHLITVSLTTPDGKELRKILVMPVRVNDPEIAVTQQFALGIGERFTFDAEVFAGMRLGTASATLTAGPLARFDVPGLLRQLDRYPYGCTEQVTSAAMPLLYLSGFAQSAGLGAPAELSKRIDGAIARVLTRQASNGAFGLWGADTGEFWLDAYVSDFLSRARREGYAVPDLAFSLAMDNLRNRISYSADFDSGGEAIAYALLVLAREGAAAMGDLRYFADVKGDDFATPLAAAQVGAALAAYGDPLRADKMFRRAIFLLAQSDTNRSWRRDFGTSLRDTAAVLKLSAEAGSQVVDTAILVSSVGRVNRRLSTQEAAQVVMAAQALASPGAVPALMVNGAPATGPVVQRLTDVAPTSAMIENVSTAPMDVTMTTYGVPVVAPAQGGYGYALKRTYYTMGGAPVGDLVSSGDRLVVVLEVTPFEGTGARLMVDDPLPAGFEIDNPNLLQSGQVGALDWLKAAGAEYTEFRSDRFLAAVTHKGTDPFRLAYIVRAVTPGDYHHSAATVEDMYRPEYRANTATGRLIVLR